MMIQEFNRAIQFITDDHIRDIANYIRGYQYDNKLIAIVGNGGSNSTASHFTADLLRRGYPVVNPFDNTEILTAVSNDVNFNQGAVIALEPFRYHLGLVIVFSVSGESPNLLELQKAAKSWRVPTLVFASNSDSTLAKEASKSFIIPSKDYGVVESAHLMIAHGVAQELKRL